MRNASSRHSHADLSHGTGRALDAGYRGVALEQALTAVACLRTLASAAAEALCSGGRTWTESEAGYRYVLC